MTTRFAGERVVGRYVHRHVTYRGERDGDGNYLVHVRDVEFDLVAVPGARMVERAVSTGGGTVVRPLALGPPAYSMIGSATPKGS